VKYKTFIRNPKGKDQFEDLSIDGKKILKCILEKQGVKMWTRVYWLRMGSNGRLLFIW